MTVLSEVALIFHQGDKTSIVASRQQINGV